MVLTWFWTGLGVAAVYLLYKIHGAIQGFTSQA